MRWKNLKIIFFVLKIVLISAFSYQASAQNEARKHEETGKAVEKTQNDVASSGRVDGENANLAASETIETEQPLRQPSPQEEASSKYPDPNLIPYRTRKSALVHLFSIPAKVWRLIWTPLGATIIWVEQNRIQEKAINFFLNDDRTGGFFPLVSFGGNTGAGAGLTVFHNNLFNQRKKINLSFLYSTADNNTITLAYSDSTLFGSSFYFNLLGDFFNDSDENLFIGSAVSSEEKANSSIGANQTTDDDETSYATEQGGVMVNSGYAINQKIGLGITSSFKRANIDSGDGFGGFQRDIPGVGTTSLFSIGTTITFNFTNGWPRTLSGTLFRFAYQYNRELNGSQFEYNRYTVEAHQFIPIPFLAKNRRLGIRGRFEKIDRLNGKQIPFYELSLLGDAATLRGFDQNRFRGRGSLLFNLEYRYPVWDTWDAVIFIDEGQVYDDLNDIDFGEFHFAAGAGLRFMSPTGFAFRFEVGASSEAVRGLFQITPNF